MKTINQFTLDYIALFFFGAIFITTLLVSTLSPSQLDASGALLWGVSSIMLFVLYLNNILTKHKEEISIQEIQPRERCKFYDTMFTPLPHDKLINTDKYKNPKLLSELESIYTLESPCIISGHSIYYNKLDFRWYKITNEPFAEPSKIPSKTLTNRLGEYRKEFKKNI